MKFFAIIAFAGFAIWAAYAQGHRVGLSDAPEMAKVQDRHNQEIESLLSAEFDNPTDDEIMCDQILEALRTSATLTPSN